MPDADTNQKPTQSTGGPSARAREGRLAAAGTAAGGGPSACAREKLLGQRGWVVWLTGLPASGKTTIARALEQALLADGRLACVLDGDQLRAGLNRDLGFSPQDRQENIRRVGEVAALFADAGAIAIVAFISPYRAGRERARSTAPAGRFLEVYVQATLAVCEARDPKGLYRKARAGQLSGLTGVDAPYEPPPSPEVTLDTTRMSVVECVQAIRANLGL